MKNVNSFQVIFYAANAAGSFDASGLDSRLDAGLSVDNFVCVDNSVDNGFDNSVDDCFDNSFDNSFDDSVDDSVDNGFDDSVNDGFDRAAKF
jgi:hypothetical protein